MEYLSESDRNQAPEQVSFLLGVMKRSLESNFLSALQTYTEQVIDIQKQKNSLALLGDNNPYFNNMLHKQIEFLQASADYSRSKCNEFLERIDKCCECLHINNPYQDFCFLSFQRSA